MKAFPLIKDLVTDVSWNYRVKNTNPGVQARRPTRRRHLAHGQADIERVQEFRKCIECFLCQDVCHVLREHSMHEQFIGPRFLTYVAALEMHPLDTADRIAELERGARRGAVQHQPVLHPGSAPRTSPSPTNANHPP